jgi:transcriptional regulator with XRE-family HTH domain
VAQRAAELNPLASTRHLFGAELRYWRLHRQLSLARLARAAHVSADLIGKIEKAQRWPNNDLVGQCEAILDSGGVLPRLYALAAYERRAHRATDRSPKEGFHLSRRTSLIVILPADSFPWPTRFTGVPMRSDLVPAGTGHKP